MKMLLLGAISMASFVIAVILLRFWRTTRDRFFLFFAAAFFIEGARRATLGLIPLSTEKEPLFFLLQLVAYMVIVYAIIDKNRGGAERG